MKILSILKKKHKHDWVYPTTYSDGAIRTCKTCGETQKWQEVHYGTWIPQGTWGINAHKQRNKPSNTN